MPQPERQSTRRVVIGTVDDWTTQRLPLVPDPMVIRSAQVFLTPADSLARDDRARTEQALAMNAASLRDFIDTLVLNSELPVFDYAATYGSSESLFGDSAQLWQMSEDLGLGLISVDVAPPAYDPAKATAAAQLAAQLKLRECQPDASTAELNDLLSSIEDELGAFDYEWKPALSAELLSSTLATKGNQTAVRFALGERIFNYYAEELGVPHLVQSKRRALAMQLWMPPRERRGWSLLSRRDLDTISRLVRNEIGQNRMANIEMPSFVGYLLAGQPASPEKLVEDAIKLRSEPHVKRFRERF